MKQNNTSQPTEAPVEEGGIYTGSIESVGAKGDGILRIKGFVVFVPGVQQGDFVKVKVVKLLPKVSFGELVEKVEPPKPSSRKKSKEEPDEPDEYDEMLTTEGDSEDFGEE
ncbi:MAG: TRAM domain-containing protein [Nanobdellota archaeon]